jgi:hypothetical protein
MKASEARNLLIGDLVDFACGPDYDTGYVKEVRASRNAVFALIRSTTDGYGTELVHAGRILEVRRKAIQKPAPTIGQCRAMTRGYLP